MEKGRLEAFSDGVIAILITIMVLELHVPTGHDWASLRPLAPTLASYLLSFIYLGIYWNNHHHMLQAIEKVNGNVLWANLHLLFWLSLVPWGTHWVGETHFAPLPVALYGMILLLAGAAYFILSRQLVALHGEDSVLGRAVGADVKGRVSLVLYALAVGATLVESWIACALYVVVAIMWLVPDRRIESMLGRS